MLRLESLQATVLAELIRHSAFQEIFSGSKGWIKSPKSFEGLLHCLALVKHGSNLEKIKVALVSLLVAFI